MNKLKYLKVLCTKILLLSSLSASEITSYTDVAVFSDNNKLMALSSYANKMHSVSLWDVNQSSFKQTKQFDFDDDTIVSNNILFSHDNQFFVAGANTHVYIWHTKTHKLIKKLSLPYAVTALTFSNDDNYLFVGTEKEKITIWNAKKEFEFYKNIGEKKLGFIEKLFSKKKTIKSGELISFAISDKYLIATFEYKDAQIYDMKNNFKMVKKFNHKKDYIYTVHFTKDHKQFITARNDVELEVYEAKPPFRKVKTIKKNTEEEIYATALSKKNRYYLTSWDYEGKIKVFDVQKNFKQIETLKGHWEYTTSLNFYDNDKFLLSVGGDNNLKVWEVGTWKNITTIHLEEDGKFSVK